jgi:threonine dehydratase
VLNDGPVAMEGARLPDAAELLAARDRLRPHLPPTPVVSARDLSRRTGASVYLKLETLQPTHSFKVRGALNAVLALGEERRRAGVVAASQGNHGLGVAWAAARTGVPATVYLPRDAPQARVDALEDLGSAVVLRGDSWDEANEHAEAEAQLSGRCYIHPFANRRVMAGAATLVLELREQLPSIDVLVASVGGGGLLSGLIAAVRAFSPRTRVFGVETVGADCMARSLSAGHIVTLPEITSIARSLGARRTEALQFETARDHAEDVVVVSDADTRRWTWETWRHERVLVEPAAACVIAALAAGRIRTGPGDTVVAVMCGGNVELEEVRSSF